MFKKLLRFLGFRAGGEIETQKFEPLRRSTDKFPDCTSEISEITEAYASGRLPKRTTYVDKVRRNTEYGRISTQLPPPSKTVFYDPGIASSVQEEAQRIIRTIPAELFSSDTDGIQAKGGEFSGAGASGSWDSPSSSSSDTSSSSSDSGSSGCGSD